MQTFFKSGIAAIALMMALGVSAQSRFTIGGGGGKAQGSVYSSVLGDLAGQCSNDDFKLEEVPPPAGKSAGGVTNLEMLLGNKVNAALVPSGLLFKARDENASSVANIRTLFALHPEAIYLIARGDTKKEGGVNLGFTKIGATDVSFNNPEDLKGRPVGAVGGSLIDGQTISDKMRLGWVMTEFGKTTELLGALTTGKIDAVVIQAGIPSPAVAALKGNFKIIPIRGNSDTQAVWSAIKVQYSNLNQGRSVDTIAAPALLVTRKWSSPEMNAKLATLVACYKARLGTIKDTTDTDPVWQSVELENQGGWPLYELPKVAAPAPAPVAEPVKAPAKKK